MKISLPASLVFSVSLLLGFNAANATIVQSALAPNKIGISVEQLMATTAGNVALPTTGNRPAAMANASKGINLGTNTDIFAIGTPLNYSEFWVRYTLDSSSSKNNSYILWDDDSYEYTVTENSSITGDLWLKFDINNQQFAAFDEQLMGTDIWYYENTSGTGFSPRTNQGNLNSLKGGSTGYPDYAGIAGSNAYMYELSGGCLECWYVTQLNLAFLELGWDGTKYNLFTSSEGFAQIFKNDTNGYGYTGELYSTTLNIAPVPVPAAAWLMGSGLIGLIGVARRQ